MHDFRYHIIFNEYWHKDCYEAKQTEVSYV